MGVSEPGRMSLPPPRELELPERDPVKAEVKDSLKQIIEAVVMRHFVEEQASSRCHSLRVHGACAHSTYAPQATLLAELEDYQLQCWTRDEARHRERLLKRGSFSGLQRGGCSALQPQRSAARSQAASLHQATRPRSPGAAAGGGRQRAGAEAPPRGPPRPGCAGCRGSSSHEVATYPYP